MQASRLMRRGVAFAATALTLAFAATPASAQQGDGTEVGFPIHIFKPDKVEATPERVASLKAPAGFKVSVFASGLKNARVLAVAPDGTVYVSRRDQGDVLMLKDAGGRAAAAPVVVARRAGAHGLAIRDGKLYLVTVKELFVADIQADGTLGPPTLLVGDLPDAGQHANRTIAFGPDGMLYLSVGSTCNDCNENNPENATLLRITPDGKTRSIVATGLRNTIGFAWHPRTGELWGMDHGIDFLGDEVQPEELNRIEYGKNYGWPHIYAGGEIYPQSTPVGEISKATWKAMSTPMALGYRAHAAPMQMLFYSGGSYPASFEGDAFVTMRGSWNRNPASGYEIVRVRFENGQPRAFEPFVTGFLSDDGKTHFARPVGLAMAKDGALLMADDANGVIYRVAYEGRDARTAMAPAVPRPGPMREQAMRGSGMPLVFERAQPSRPAEALQLQSAFAEGAPIDKKYSSYFDDVSPPLRWNAVAGARSYAVFVEDPDARPLTPFVHWVAWNIPASLTALEEGLQKQPRLTAPEGLLQGRNSRGSVGWYGPHPPVGEPPHHYHVEVIALDTMLDVLPGADRDTVMAAAKGHVVGKGRLVGTYQQNERPLK